MSAEHQPNNLQQPRVRCPKGTKMSKSIKTFGALGPFKTKEERRHFMRSMAIANHEAAHRPKKSFASNSASDASTRAIAVSKNDTSSEEQ